MKHNAWWSKSPKCLPFQQQAVAHVSYFHGIQLEHEKWIKRKVSESLIRKAGTQFIYPDRPKPSLFIAGTIEKDLCIDTTLILVIGILSTIEYILR